MKLRIATFDDYEGILEVGRRNGGVPRDAFDAWKGYWLGNPFYTEQVPIGWVIEDALGQIVGTFSNVPLGYEWNGKPLRAATGRAWAVDARYRHAALRLGHQFATQENVDLLLSTTTSEQACRLFTEGLQFQCIPPFQPPALWFWITSYPKLAHWFLRKKKVPLARVAAAPAGLALWGWDRLRGQNRIVTRHPAVRTIDQFDERFDAFWSALRRRPNRLLAVRTRAALAWHFHSLRLRDKARILVLEEQSRMTGYAVLLRKEAVESGTGSYELADLQVLDDRNQDVQALLVAALRLARHDGIAVVTMCGFDAFKRRAIEELRPHARNISVWPFFYRAATAEIQSLLGQPAAWDLCPYDGDSSL